MNNLPNSENQQNGPDRTRLYLALAVVVTLFLIIVVVVALVRALRPSPLPTLRLTPAAAPLEDLEQVIVSSSGWPRGEEVTICLAEPEALECTPDGTVAIEQATGEGDLEVNLQITSLLAQGFTNIVARGAQSGLVVSKAFRVLQSAGDRTPSPEPGATDTPTPELTPTAEPTIPTVFNGWRGEYFDNPSLAGAPVVVRDDPDLAFSWGAGSPDPAVPVDGFSARWSRRLSFEGRRYRFLVQADDGVRLLIDGRLVIDEWRDLAVNPTYSADLDLLPGEHEVVLEYYENRGDALVELDWQTTDEFSDWRGEYYANPSLSGAPVVVRNDTAVNFDWSDGSPVPGVVPNDGFSARWSRTVDFAAGIYRFTVAADDGVRLLVDGQLLIDQWRGADSGPYTFDWTLTEGAHRVQVEFFENVGAAQVSLAWNRLPDNTSTPEPTPTSEPTATATTAPSNTPLPTTAPTNTPTFTPTPALRSISLEPTQGWAGTVITVTGVNWPAALEVNAALLVPGADIGQAEDVTGADGVVGADGAIEVVFIFPNQSRWLDLLQVQVVLHDEDWRVRGFASFSPVEP